MSNLDLLIFGVN